MSLSAVTAPPPPGSDEIRVFGCFRNAALRLPDFLAHHRRLGVDRFVLVDNASDDGSAALLAGQPDVHLFHTAQSYSESRCGIDWLNPLLEAHGQGHWCLILDDDEHFIFPGWEQADLPALTRWLDSTGVQGMRATMLDMYPDGPLATLVYRAGQSLAAACPMFDGSGYTLGRDGLPVRGGPRHRLFWEGRDRAFPSPVLHKTPLVRWRAGLALTASTHEMSGVTVGAAAGALLHYKFLQDFAAEAAAEVARGEHFAGARQYAAYAEVLGDEAAFTAVHDGSVRLDNSWQLVDLNLMRAPEGYPFRPGTEAEMSGHWSNFLMRGTEARADLGGNLRHGDGMTITPRLWQALVDRFAPRVMLDVGAGEGHAAAWFARAGLIAHGIDGLPANVAAARHPIALHDLTAGPYVYPCDLAYCVEVAEHIREDCVDHLLDTLANAPVVAMTHALPGQRGHHHVNLQPQSYWVEKFAARGYRLAIDNDAFRALAAEEKPGCYFEQSGLVFLRAVPGQERADEQHRKG